MWARQIDYCCPEHVCCSLANRPGLALLDSSLPDSQLGRYSYLCIDPVHTIEVRRRATLVDGESVACELFEILRSLLSRPAASRLQDGPPFQGGLVGYFTYEFAEQLMEWSSAHWCDDCETLAEFGLYDTVIAWDHGDRKCWVMSLGLDGPSLKANAALAASRIKGCVQAIGSAPARPRHDIMECLVWTGDTDRQAYLAAVERVKAYIKSGDIYQANIAQILRTTLPQGVPAFELYLALRRANPAPFSAYLDFPARQIASTSPERFVTVTAGQVEARPIKGTIRRADDPEEDAILRETLTNSEKDRAENIMIVDLMRNDLSKVCAPHSVKTPQICTLESFAGLHHLVSSVTGRLKPGYDAFDLVAAAFPGGSITGAPKLRAMEIISELETDKRGVFCGSIGYIGFNGDMDLNIAIRTVEIDGQAAKLHVGGGITSLSDPCAEYAETLLKAQRIISPPRRRPAA